VEADLRRQQDNLRQTQADAFAAAQDLSRVRNEITALDLQKQGHTIRLEKLSAEKIQLEEERSGLEVRLKDFAVTVNEQKLSAQSQRGTVEERQARLREIQSELETAGRQQDKVLEEQAEKRSRLDLLEQLASEHEGFSAGSLAALRQSQNVLGSLADKIRVPDQFVTAIETALGHHLQLVLTEESGAAKQILEDLKNAKKGRASIAALALTRNDDSPKGSELDPGLNTGVMQGAVAAASVVECEDSVRPLLARLLDTTRIVKDLEEALTAYQSGQSQFDYVTLTGEILSRHGVFTGGQNNGQTNGKAPSSILGRKNQITSLTKALAELHIRVAELSRAKGALQSEQTALNASLQDAQTELRAQEVAIATREGEFLALQNSQRLLHQKIDTVVYEIQSLAAQEKEGAEKRHALVSHAAQAESREQESQAKVTQLTHDLESLRKDRDSANAALTDSRVSLAADEQLLASFEQQRISLGQRVQELSERIAQRKSELGSFVSRKEQAETEIEKSRMRIEGLQHEREQVSEQVAALVAEKQSQDAEVGRREETLREQRRALSGLQEKRGAIEVELAQKNMSVENLSDRIRQKYQLNIADIRSECITITLADEGAAKVHVMTPEEMASSGAATDWESVAQEVQALQRRIEEMGPVNLVAIEEYEETEQRHQFLSQQHDDLVQAKAQLLEVINRINVQTREMFRITFEQIRDNFRAMFTEVFGGGKADLVMMDENDVLESGIEIVAKPPGKQLQTISLLSGGEQTMTAVSLLFSIYQVKPSPFCVLDELDAPLDESNINRFIRVLQRFLTHSQFIIITHNKRTIGMADVLYGVTMQEQGVSRIVSVKFHKSDEETDGKAVGLETPTSVRSVDKEEDAPHRREETMEIVMAK
jgi:chromosome segregation protein